jgi:hypothetical protein
MSQYRVKRLYVTSDEGVTTPAVPDGSIGADGLIIDGVDIEGTGGAAKIGYNQGGTGAVDRTVAAKLQESVSVKDFGAVGDGVTDDTVAIQAALNDASNSGGGTVLFPPGTYIVNNTITIPNKVNIKGSGGQSGDTYDYSISKIKAGASFIPLMGTSTPLIMNDNGAYGFVKDITFDGSFYADIVWHIRGAQSCLFQNVMVTQGSDRTTGIAINITSSLVGETEVYAAFNTFINVQTNQTGRIGLWINGYSNGKWLPVTDNTFIGCTFFSNVIGIRITASDTNMFFGGGISAGAYGLIINDEALAYPVGGNNFYGFYMQTFEESTVGIAYNDGGIAQAFCILRDVEIYNFTTFYTKLGSHTYLKVVDADINNSGIHDISTLSLSGSPYTYVNDDPYEEELIVSGGTVSNISIIRGGVTTTTGLTSGIFRLNVRESLSITYSSTPTVLKRPINIRHGGLD